MTTKRNDLHEYQRATGVACSPAEYERHCDSLRLGDQWDIGGRSGTFGPVNYGHQAQASSAYEGEETRHNSIEPFPNREQSWRDMGAKGLQLYYRSRAKVRRTPEPEDLDSIEWLKANDPEYQERDEGEYLGNSEYWDTLKDREFHADCATGYVMERLRYNLKDSGKTHSGQQQFEAWLGELVRIRDQRLNVQFIPRTKACYAAPSLAEIAKRYSGKVQVRRVAIGALLSNGLADTDQIRAKLAEEGIKASQPTLSRDLTTMLADGLIVKA